jgi:hypothetical protein
MVVGLGGGVKKGSAGSSGVAGTTVWSGACVKEGAAGAV